MGERMMDKNEELCGNCNNYTPKHSIGRDVERGICPHRAEEPYKFNNLCQSVHWEPKKEVKND